MAKHHSHHQFYRIMGTLTLLLLTAQSLFAAQANSCLSLFAPTVTDPTINLDGSIIDLTSARAALSAKSTKSVRKYLEATAESSKQTFRFLEQIREVSKLNLYRDTADAIPDLHHLQSAVINQKAPLFNALVPQIFPENFRPNREEDWVELKKQMIKNFPINDFIRFQMLKTEEVQNNSLPFAGLHLLSLAQSQLRDVFEEILPQLSSSTKLGLELALATRLNRFEKNPQLLKKLFSTLTLLNFPSERIQLLLISQWIYYYGEAKLLDNDEQRDRSQQLQNQNDFKEGLQSAIYRQLALANKYSDLHNSKLYWLLSTHPEILQFILNEKIRLLPQTHAYIRQVLVNLRDGTLMKKDYGLALTAILYLNNFEHNSALIEDSLEILSRARGVYPYIKSDAKKLLRELKKDPPTRS